MPSVLPDDPRIVPLEPGPPLAGPPGGGALRGPGSGLDAVTGGGLAALVDPTRGLHSLWRGEVRAAGLLRLAWGDRPLHPAAGIGLDGAGWVRELALPGGERLVERAVLLDSAPALLLEWTPSVAGRLELELQPAGGGRPLGVRLPVAREGARVALVPPGTDLDALLPRVRPPRARERARREGRRPGALGGPCLRISVDGRDRIDAATALLARAPLGLDPDGRPVGPFLLGVRDAEPRFAHDAALAEIGIGALLAGLVETGWSALEALAGSDSPPPLPTLHLAATLGRWTGDAARLALRRSFLDACLDRLLADPSERSVRGAAFPGPRRVVESLAAAVEPLGGDWARTLERAQLDRTALDRSGGRDAPPGGRAPRVSLPVLGGGPGPPAPPRAAEAAATLPHPRDFTQVDHPGVAERRTLHAARLVRAWVEGVLGAEADAAYGRLRLAPDLRRVADPRSAPPARLEIRGIRLRDGGVGIDCRLDPGTCTLRLLQDGGRVPIVMAFEPRLPLEPPLAVRLGDDEADPTIEAVEGGAALSCQFPLDPERRILVEERR